MSNNFAEGGKICQLWLTIGIITCITLFELTFFTAQYIFAPEYTAPLFTSVMGIVICLILIGWQILGFVWMFYPAKSVPEYIVKAAVVSGFCVLPTILMGTLGPAFITISQAIGPIVETAK